MASGKRAEIPFFGVKSSSRLSSGTPLRNNVEIAQVQTHTHTQPEEPWICLPQVCTDMPAGAVLSSAFCSVSSFLSLPAFALMTPVSSRCFYSALQKVKGQRLSDIIALSLSRTSPVCSESVSQMFTLVETSGLRRSIGVHRGRSASAGVASCDQATRT